MGSGAAAWARIWDDAWAVRIKTLAYALREKDMLAAEERATGARLVGPPPPPALEEGRWGYPARWNWILWPGQEQTRGTPPANYRSLIRRR